MSLTIDDHKFAIVLANSGLTIGEAAERAGMSRQRFHAILNSKKATFIIVVHVNKQSGVYGRKRIADSSDIWDASRSVLMLGETQEKGVRYLTQEKSNYGKLEKTALYTLNDKGMA